MNDERCDRDRVTAILGIRFALTPDEEWLARTLLEALNTIDRLEGEKEALVRELYIADLVRGLGEETASVDSKINKA